MNEKIWDPSKKLMFHRKGQSFDNLKETGVVWVFFYLLHGPFVEYRVPLMSLMYMGTWAGRVSLASSLTCKG